MRNNDTTKKAHREFWLYSRGPSYIPDVVKTPYKKETMPEGERYYVPSTNTWTNFQEEVHVIEKLAYDSEVKRADRNYNGFIEYRRKSNDLQTQLDAANEKLTKLSVAFLELDRQSEALAAALKCFEHEEVGLADIETGKQALAEYERFKNGKT